MKKLLSRLSIAVFLALVLFLVSTFALPAMAAQADSEPECWAVIAGVSNYQAISDLNYGDDDAQDLYQALSPVWGTSHMLLLKDWQATKSAILSGIDWIADNADENDTVLFFFSGHGSDYGGGYFCPYDSLTTSWDNDISATELENALAPIRADQVVVILDCCYSGCFQNELSESGRVIMMACSSYEVSYEYTALRNGAFTYFILEALGKFDEVDTNDDYILSAEEVAAYANPETYQYEYDQSPFTDDMYYEQLALMAKFAFALNIALPFGTNILTLDGVNYTSAPAPVIWAPGSTHTVVVPDFVELGVGTRYTFTDWSNGNTSPSMVIYSGNLIANYLKEHLLNIISDYGDPQGGGWHEDGTYVGFSVTPSIFLPDTRHYFTGWSGDYMGTAPSATILMDSPATITASWRHEYLLSVISAYGDPQGEGWYDEGATAYFSVTPYIELPDTRHIFMGWDGDYTGVAQASSISMDSPATVTADWRHEYLLTLNSDYGTLTGAGWYNKGDIAEFSVTPYVEFSDSKHYFTGWSGDYTGMSSSASLKMNDPSVVDANWRHEYLLTLNSEYGEPTGAGWYDEGEAASISVEPVQGFLIRHIFTGWSGDLSDTDADSSTMMNSPKTITATWETDYIQLYILIGGVAVLGGATTTTVILLRRRAHVKHIVPAAPVVQSAAPIISAPPPSAPAASTTPPVTPVILTPPPAAPVIPAQAPPTPTVHITRGRLTLPDNSQVPLSEPVRYIGRDDFSKVASPDALRYVSRRQCVITAEAGRYFIEDLKSANGTKVNGVDIGSTGKQELKNGDRIDLAGIVTLLFDAGV